MIKLPCLVLDTNIVISAILWKGKPDQFLAHAETGTIALHTRRALLDEFADTLRRPKFTKRIERTGRSLDQIISGYRQLAHLTRPAVLEQRYSRDPDDDLLVLGSVDGIRILRVAEVLGEFA